MSVGSASFYPFGDASGSFSDRVLAAAHAVTAAQSTLSQAIDKVGMTRTYVGDDSQSQLRTAIEQYSRAVARHEMLSILQSEDFYVLMARSAGAAQS
jgi:arginine repressor